LEQQIILLFLIIALAAIAAEAIDLEPIIGAFFGRAGGEQGIEP